jgi:tRNA pseudouridine55 synthase
MATGVLVLLVGRDYTKLSDRFLGQDKEYLAQITLGSSTDTYDAEGVTQENSSLIPSLEEVTEKLNSFQGVTKQIPPMFSAKKVQGKKLYELARDGKEIEREAVSVRMSIELLNYSYPHISLKISCSKGTYIRSLAHDLGIVLKCYAHLSALRRVKSGPFDLKQSIEGEKLVSNTLLKEDVIKNLKDLKEISPVRLTDTLLS